MTQFARPDSTLITGSWTPSSSTQHGDTSDQSNATYITASFSSTAITMTLGDVTDPAISTGHTLYVRTRSSGSGGPERFSLQLYQGSTPIAAPFSNQDAGRGTAWNEFSYTLIATEADAITDYTDLRVRIEPSGLKAGERVEVSEFWLEVPDNSSTLTISDLSSSPTVGAVTLSQTHNITVAGLDVSATIAAVVLDQQGRPLTVADMSVSVDVTPSWLVDSDGEIVTDTEGNPLTESFTIELLQSGENLNVFDASASPTAGNVTLTGTHNITVADATASPTIDGALDVDIVFVVDQFGSIDSVATVDNVDLTGTHFIMVADISASPTADNIDLGDTLEVADVSASPTIEGGALAAPHLTVADARTIGRVRNLTLESNIDLVISDMSVTTTIANVLLVPYLAISDMSVTTTLDTFALEQFFTGVVGLTLDTRSLTLTLDTRSLTLTIDTRTGG